MAKIFLLTDTNILSHALSQNKKLAYAEFFKSLENEYRLLVSGYTQYELTCSSDKQHREKVIEYIAQDLSYIALSEAVMKNAARVYYLYSKHPSTAGYKIGSGDIINASVSIALDCPLITIDNNDYPRPFFEETGRERITYQTNKNKEVTDTVYTLRPDMENIKKCFVEHKV